MAVYTSELYELYRYYVVYECSLLQHMNQPRRDVIDGLGKGVTLLRQMHMVDPPLPKSIFEKWDR